jgi:hypothetical protein
VPWDLAVGYAFLFNILDGAAELSECFMRQFVNDRSSLQYIAASETWQISSPV